jgi:hypothetical protein
MNNFLHPVEQNLILLLRVTTGLKVGFNAHSVDPLMEGRHARGHRELIQSERLVFFLLLAIKVQDVVFGPAKLVFERFDICNVVVCECVDFILSCHMFDHSLGVVIHSCFTALLTIVVEKRLLFVGFESVSDF